MQQTLVLIKPDAVQRGLTGDILSRFEKRGLKIVAMKMMTLDNTLAKRHYSDHQDKPFFQSLVTFITSGPIVAIVLEGRNAVEAVRNMMGKTDSLKSPPGTIRGDLGLDVEHNLVHGSDSEQSAAKEIPVFFNPDEILTYTRAIDPWITAS
ncbi:MAG: nucleoside-diphosphate kinase [Chloroflexota bacterium]|nr:nucleoside-diphosphate kinase [Chloroflexota bacterium]